MTDRQLTTGEPVPADDSHKQIDAATGQQLGYVVLTPQERAKGFVKPLRHSYVHAYPSEIERIVGCGVETRMGTALAETYARDPYFYSGTFCVGCKAHFPLDQFVWDNGEPMLPELQPAWHEQRDKRRREAIRTQIADLRSEADRLERELVK